MSKSGSWRPVADRRWWCDRHRDQAGPSDHLPMPPTYYLGPTGGLRLNPESAEGKERKAKDEGRRREQAEREQADKREAEALQAVIREYEQTAEVSIGGVRVHPGNVTVNGK